MQISKCGSILTSLLRQIEETLLGSRKRAISLATQHSWHPS